MYGDLPFPFKEPKVAARSAKERALMPEHQRCTKVISADRSTSSGTGGAGI
jgi:hypothetical protein